MQRTLAGILLTLMLSTTSLLALEFEIGTSLYQSREDYLVTIDSGLHNKHAAGPGNLEYRVYIPVFFASGQAPFVAGQDLIKENTAASTNDLTVLRKKHYAPIMLPQLSYEWGKTTFGIDDTFRQEVASSLIIWGDPTFYSESPFFRSRFSVRDANGGLYSSSTIDPTFVMGFYTLRPFKGSKQYLLDEIEITPVAYNDFVRESSPQHFGAGFDLKTGGFRRPTWAFGALASFLYSQRKENGRHSMFQGTAGMWFAFWTFKIDGGFIAQSSNHPNGPYLSALYAGRRTVELGSSSSTVAGNFLTVSLPGEGVKDKSFGIKGRASIMYYSKPVGSLHTFAYYQSDETEFRIGFLKEDIANYRAMNRHHNVNNYVSLAVLTKLIAKRLRFSWQTYLNYADISELRSRFSLSIVF